MAAGTRVTGTQEIPANIDYYMTILWQDGKLQ